MRYISVMLNGIRSVIAKVVKIRGNIITRREKFIKEGLAIIISKHIHQILPLFKIELPYHLDDLFFTSITHNRLL
jgi:hypothetical protein